MGREMKPRREKAHFVISCHADTGFRTHRLRRTEGICAGHLDNFAGVHAVMNAYFSGKMDVPCLRIELTYGEETDMEGAAEVLRTLSASDVVVVVDVTGTPTSCDITIEKCASPSLQSFVKVALEGMSYELHADCPDPVADEDECDVYAEKIQNVFFLGIPCRGGDYNSGEVSCSVASISAATEALIRLSSAFNTSYLQQTAQPSPGRGSASGPDQRGRVTASGSAGVAAAAATGSPNVRRGVGRTERNGK